MCTGCGRLWTALQVAWSTVYVVCGAAQLISGIFFMISLPTLHLSCNMWTGAWNVIVGITAGMTSCMSRPSSRRQEFLLYMAVSILTANCVNVVLAEWGLYLADMSHLLKNHPNRMLISYACFGARVAAAAVILVSFLDSQFAFCSMQAASSEECRSNDKKRRLHGSHDQVSDIEYIIPRPKSSKPHSTLCNAYSQSWVFETQEAASSTATPSSNTLESPYLKILENGTNHHHSDNNNDISTKRHHQSNSGREEVEPKPVVHVEEASDDSNSNQSDRKLNHMRSFSRSTSPIHQHFPHHGGSSSHLQVESGSVNVVPIYDCLESIYRTRLNSNETMVATPMRRDDDAISPQPIASRRMESVSPHAEKVQYASLMKELQKAIVNKKEPTSPGGGSSTTASCKGGGANSASSSDAEFSKELEAALQLIQDLESPNTVDTVTTPNSEGRRSDSEKTLNAVGSLADVSDGNGKVIVHCTPPPLDSQSTSGYSSPTSHQPTPTSWSTTSSLNGSSSDVTIGYSISNAKGGGATVISLYSTNNKEVEGSGGTLKNSNVNKSVTRINITGENVNKEKSLRNDSSVSNSSSGWRSLLRKKKQNSVPRLCPELEGAIVKSESLAYLTETELVARHRRNEEIQREIEERIIQQLGVPRTESTC